MSLKLRSNQSWLESEHLFSQRKMKFHEIMKHFQQIMSVSVIIGDRYTVGEENQLFHPDCEFSHSQLPENEELYVTITRCIMRLQIVSMSCYRGQQILISQYVTIQNDYQRKEMSRQFSLNCKCIGSVMAYCIHAVISLK